MQGFQNNTNLRDFIRYNVMYEDLNESVIFKFMERNDCKTKIIY